MLLFVHSIGNIKNRVIESRFFIVKYKMQSFLQQLDLQDQLRQKCSVLDMDSWPKFVARLLAIISNTVLKFLAIFSWLLFS